MKRTGILFLFLAGIGLVASPPAALALTTGSIFSVGATGSNSSAFYNVSMAYGNGKYAVAYPTTSGLIQVAFVDATSGALGSTYTVNAGVSPAGWQGKVKIAYDIANNRFGVAWMNHIDNSSSNIQFNWIKTDGTLMGTPVNVTSGYPYPDGPDLIWDGSRYVLAFSLQSGGAWVSLEVIAFGAGGSSPIASAMIDVVPVSSLPSDPNNPDIAVSDAFGAALAYNGSGYGLVYGKGNGIYYAYLNSSLATTYGPAKIDSAGYYCGGQKISADGSGNFGALWNWKNSPGSPTAAAIYYAKLGSGGIISSTVLSSGVIDSQSPDIGWDGSRFISAWADAPSGGVWNTKAATHNVSGTLDTTATLLGTFASIDMNVAARAADNYLIVWRLPYDQIQACTATNQIMLTATPSPSTGGVCTSDSGWGPFAGSPIVTVTETPNVGWTFTGWSGDTTGATYPAADKISVTMDHAKSIVANFFDPTSPTMFAAVSPNGAGSATVNGAASAQAAVGTAMSLLATANTGYIFHSWKDAAGTPIGTNRAMSYPMPIGGTTVTAYFDVAYSVSTTANPTNGGSVSPTGSLWYATGTQVSFTATPAGGYTFTSWTVNGADAGTTNPLTIPIDSTKTIYANFTYGGGGTTYTLITAVSPTGTGTVSPAGTTVYASGSSVQLKATPSTGYVFDKWTGSVTGSTNPVTISMNGNKTVTAQFKEGTGGNAPQISSLTQTTSIKSKKATFSVNYADTDGDLSGGSVKATYWYKPGGKQYNRTYDIPGEVTSVSGTTSGTIVFQIKFRNWKSSYRNFDLTVYLADAAGLSSNTATLKVRKNKKASSGREDFEGARPSDE